MRMPMKARLSLRFALLSSAILLGACGRDITAPESMTAPATAALGRTTTASMDESYSINFDPTQDQVFTFGGHTLVMPANSVCSLKGMRYGVSYWDTPCTTETRTVKLQVKVIDPQGPNPAIDFLPAMRFSPDKNVQLTMAAPSLSDETKPWAMWYCNDAGNCVEEAGRDASLSTDVDFTTKTLTRRVKHFSGYVVAENRDAAER
jgi:hypothetical protein